MSVYLVGDSILNDTLEEKGNEVVKSVKEISDGDMEDLEDDESDTEEEKSDEEIIDGQMKDFGRR